MQFFTKFYKKIPPKKIGGIGCINIDHPDMYKLYSGEVTRLYSNFCGGLAGQAPKYVTYDSTSKSLDFELFPKNGCSRNSIQITKDSNFSFRIEKCSI